MTQNKLEQAHDHHVEPSNSGSQLTDPVCGMNVTEDSAHQFERDGEAFYFCSTKCLETFKHDPEKFLAAKETGGVVVEEAAAGTIYTCPMHPEIRQEIGRASCRERVSK